MWKLRYYLPLVGFVLPTLVIGYGFVIPSSCIRGVNELSLGFGSTVFGAALTYFAGIRAATRASCPRRIPWRTRLARFVNGQASHPRGWFGRLLGIVWTFELRKVNDETLELLEIRSADRVLDVGSGPGTGVREATRRAPDGHVTGLDVSTTMVAFAARRNRHAVRAGRASIIRIGGRDLGLAPNSLDRAYSVHSIYFWSDPDETLRQLAVALRPGGRLVLAFRPDDVALPTRFRDDVYRFYAPAVVETMARAAGFPRVRTVRRANGDDSVVWVVAER